MGVGNYLCTVGPARMVYALCEVADFDDLVAGVRKEYNEWCAEHKFDSETLEHWAAFAKDSGYPQDAEDHGIQVHDDHIANLRSSLILPGFESAELQGTLKGRYPTLTNERRPLYIQAREPKAGIVVAMCEWESYEVVVVAYDHVHQAILDAESEQADAEELKTLGEAAGFGSLNDVRAFMARAEEDLDVVFKKLQQVLEEDRVELHIRDSAWTSKKLKSMDPLESERAEKRFANRFKVTYTVPPVDGPSMDPS